MIVGDANMREAHHQQPGRAALQVMSGTSSRMSSSTSALGCVRTPSPIAILRRGGHDRVLVHDRDRLVLVVDDDHHPDAYRVTHPVSRYLEKMSLARRRKRLLRAGHPGPACSVWRRGPALKPRVRKIESISSKNTTTGMPSLAFSLARWNTSRMCRSVSPTYLFSSSGPLMFRK